MGQPVAKRLEDQGRIEPRKRRAADVRGDIDAAHAEFGGLAHFGNREMFGFVPGNRVRGENFGGERASHVANRDLVFRREKKAAH